MDEQILMVSPYGHFAAAIAYANPQSGDLPGAAAQRDRVGFMVMQRSAFAIFAVGLVVSALGLVFAGEVHVVIGLAQSLSRQTQKIFAYGYTVAPALTLGLGVLAVLPVISLVAPITRRVRRPIDATRRYRPGRHGDVTPEMSGAVSNRRAYAFVEVVGRTGTRLAILHDMLRIGREDDNDIRIPSEAIHRYHAAIYREHRDNWRIADLSGTDGNGILVNGQRCSDARLSDGDVIELGPGRLRFRAGLN